MGVLLSVLSHHVSLLARWKHTGQRTPAGTATAWGQVGVTLIGPFTLTSPSLDAACSGDKFGSHTVTSDLNGNFNFAGFASGCLPGTYVIEANDAAELAKRADRTYFARVTGEPPGGRYASAGNRLGYTAHR
ncbi:hypothetical protein NGB36_03600 [Streptomyces sp. RB6PN25]|uniref:Carboxypeptidase regulatory-like domain-containing protein n=1 Tax=Streptomyces humicola TaxID=2953240 RepID=A0ABT1PRD9_9ACTN|nr:hypothetical protein [Streptomyces humicola]